MRKIFRRKLPGCSLKVLFILLISQSAFGLEQHYKFWPAINMQGSFSQDKKWLYVLFGQLRFINEPHTWEDIIVEGGFGYKVTENKSIWLEYRWTGHRPGAPNYRQENRGIQQLNWKIMENSKMELSSRSRFEERQFSDRKQISGRFRQRLSMELNYVWNHRFSPYFYDEVFCRINKTDYIAKTFINQNRVFIGVNYRLTKSSWFEIGYINQYEVRTPDQLQDQLSHILSITYNF